MTIAGVPETIAREDYLNLIRSLGLEIDHLISLEFCPDAIRAKVYALKDGKRFFADHRTEVATHEIVIPIEG